MSQAGDLPNLLELVEAYKDDPQALWGAGMGKAPRINPYAPCSDEVTDGVPGGALSSASSLNELSLCADEGSDSQPGLAELSLCADEGSDLSGLGDLSLCADEGGDGPSDVRLKTDIEQVGTTVYGLPLFHFRYKDGDGARFEGVMAQDVLKVMPEAVSLGENGFYRVHYRRLGIEMTKV
jgi:hypothetical protein